MWVQVKILNDDVVLIARDSGRVLVGRFGTTLMVVCADNVNLDASPLILMTREADTEHKAKIKHLKLIRQLCKKSEKGEFFARPCTVEPLKDADDIDFSIHSKMDYYRWARLALMEYLDSEKA